MLRLAPLTLLVLLLPVALHAQIDPVDDVNLYERQLQNPDSAARRLTIKHLTITRVDNKDVSTPWEEKGFDTAGRLVMRHQSFPGEDYEVSWFDVQWLDNRHFQVTERHNKNTLYWWREDSTLKPMADLVNNGPGKYFTVSYRYAINTDTTFERITTVDGHWLDSLRFRSIFFWVDTFPHYPMTTRKFRRGDTLVVSCRVTSDSVSYTDYDTSYIPGITDPVRYDMRSYSHDTLFGRSWETWTYDGQRRLLSHINMYDSAEGWIKYDARTQYDFYGGRTVFVDRFEHKGEPCYNEWYHYNKLGQINDSNVLPVDDNEHLTRWVTAMNAWGMTSEILAFKDDVFQYRLVYQYEYYHPPH